MADRNLSAFFWSVADLLRGDYKQSDYGKVILPFTVLRRLDLVWFSRMLATSDESLLYLGNYVKTTSDTYLITESVNGQFVVH